MINTKKFVNLLINNKINFFSGVPDSCTNEVCNELSLRKKIYNHIAPNEGHAVSLGIGYYLSSLKLPCIYFQNSGLGNATDPLTNLMSKYVYNIPAIFLIGWRGAPNLKDEKQHVIQGKSLLNTLKKFEVKYLILNTEKDFSKVKKLINLPKKKSMRVAIIIKKNTFSKIETKIKNPNKILRFDFLYNLLKNIKKNTKIISSVGFNSRELFYIRENSKLRNGSDFLVVGGMGHTLPISIAHQAFNKKNTTICLDGDGSFLMHLGSFVLLKKFKLKKLKYILVDNNSHESIGGQKINLNPNTKQLATSFGFKNYNELKSPKKIDTTIKNFLKKKGPSFLHVKIKVGTKIKKIPRPKDFKKIIRNFTS